MRCWQPYGLSAAAKKFLSDNGVTEAKTSKCPHCGKSIVEHVSLMFTIYETKERGFYEDDQMECWPLRDGRFAKRVQDFCVWSSGPMTFDCLAIDGQKLCQWTAEEASAACGEEICFESGETEEAMQGGGPDDEGESPEEFKQSEDQDIAAANEAAEKEGA